jgi:class 3 adenylate cyclase/pimeloyl-ACP methyl ester carboxylesterase
VPGWISHRELDRQAAEIMGTAPMLDRTRHVAFDKRCTGLSSHNVDDLSLDVRVGDVEAVVADSRLDSFALGGISEGGPIALAYAARHPDRVTKLAIIGSYAFGGGLAGSPEMREALRAIVKAEWGLASKLLSELLLGENAAWLPLEQFAAFQQAAATKEDAVKILDAALAIDVRPLLPTITAPTLIIHHRNDRFVPLELGQELAACIPNARFVSFPGAHVPEPQFWVPAVRAMIEFVTGEANEVEARDLLSAQAERFEVSAHGLRTVLFTDVVGHTEMMRRLGDAKGREVLRQHERITRETLKQFGGVEVKTMGDGFMASFGSVTSAMECAIALQRAFAAREGEPLQVRVGLNAGEPIEEDGDLFGSTVILASRVAAKANGGEILIPEPVRHLLSGKAFTFSDRGEHAMKGFDDAVRLFEVRWRE